jgi:putative hemolysin
LAWITLVAIDFRSRWTRLISIYALLALMWGTFAVGGIGVTYNAFFDLVIALALASGLFVVKIAEHPMFARISRPSIQAVAMILLIQTLIVATPAPFGATIDLVRHGKAEHMTAAFAEDVRFVAAQPGPAMCESLALCYWAGKPFSVDYFTTGQKILLGAVDEAKLVELVENRHFGAIEIDESRPDNLRRLTPGFYQALAEHYVVGSSGPDRMTIYVPKPEAAATDPPGHAQPEGGAAELANPAAVFCAEQGGRHEIRPSDTGAGGVCILPDGVEVDAWQYFREKAEAGSR